MTEAKEGFCFLGLFLWFIISFVIVCETGQYWPLLVGLFFCICMLFYLLKTRTSITWESFKLSLRKHYKLTPEERLLWNSLVQKANNGYVEWWSQTQGDDICGPWIKDYTKEENDLLNKIHEYFYGIGWYVATPISTSQVNYVMYEDVKNKVI